MHRCSQGRYACEAACAPDYAGVGLERTRPPLSTVQNNRVNLSDVSLTLRRQLDMLVGATRSHCRKAVWLIRLVPSAGAEWTIW